MGKKDPVVGSVLRNMQRSGFYFRANELRDKSIVNSLFRSLREEAGIQGIAARVGARRAEKRYKS